LCVCGVAFVAYLDLRISLGTVILSRRDTITKRSTHPGAGLMVVLYHWNH